LLYLGYSRDIGSVAGEDPGAHRIPILGYRQTHDYLRGIRPGVFAVTPLAQTGLLLIESLCFPINWL
jgi:hypothetical protein